MHEQNNLPSKSINVKLKNPLRVKVAWSVRATILISILAYALSQFATVIPIVIAALITGQDYSQEELLKQPWVSLVLLGVASLGLLATLIVYLKSKKIPIKTLGLKPLKWAKMWRVPAAYGLYFIVLLISMGLLSLLVPSFNADQAQDVGFANPAGWQLLLAFIGLVIIPPIAEELFFRGFIYQGMRDNWKPMPIIYFGLAIAAIFALTSNFLAAGIFVGGTVLSVVLAEKKQLMGAAVFSSMLFALAHGQWNVAIDTFILSFALIWVFEKTGSIWASILLHAIKNLIAFGALFIIPLL